MKLIILSIVYIAILVQGKPVPDDEDDKASIQALLRKSFEGLRENGIQPEPEDAGEMEAAIDDAFGSGLKEAFGPDVEAELDRLINKMGIVFDDIDFEMPEARAIQIPGLQRVLSKNGKISVPNVPKKAAKEVGKIVKKIVKREV